MELIEGLVLIAGLTALTVLTRGFFFLSRRPLPMPPWLLKGLRFAPLAAMAAVVAPQIVMEDGKWLTSALDPRIWGRPGGGGVVLLATRAAGDDPRRHRCVRARPAAACQPGLSPLWTRRPRASRDARAIHGNPQDAAARSA